jgi:hypothetical protein
LATAVNTALTPKTDYTKDTVSGAKDAYFDYRRNFLIEDGSFSEASIKAAFGFLGAKYAKVSNNYYNIVVDNTNDPVTRTLTFIPQGTSVSLEFTE